MLVFKLECACQCKTHHALTKSQSMALKPALPELWAKVQGDTSFDVSSANLTCSKSRTGCDCRAEIIVLANTSRSSKFAARYSPTDRRRVGYTKLGQRVDLATMTALSSFFESIQLPHHGATLQYHVGSPIPEISRTCRC
jgi:hypothetical protein